jgi:5-methylcytosine-specific restriction endonuclease McrA
MQGHNIPHTEEAKLKCSIAQKRRWEMGLYKDRPKRIPIELIKYVRRYFKKGSYVKCVICRNKFFSSPSYIKNGRKYCSKRCNGIGMSLEKHSQWKGGISRKHKLIYNSLGYSSWRTSVFIRDEFTCQECGQKHIYLHAHHIKPFAKFIKNRFDVNNGVTLCKDCHRLIHKRRE